MDELVIILVRGIGLGAIYSLVAISFNVVHNSSGILNFAQGNMLVLGGLFGFFTLPQEPERHALAAAAAGGGAAATRRCWRCRATSRCCRCARRSSSIRG